MENVYGGAWSQLPLWVVEAICASRGDAAGPLVGGEPQGLRQTETWLSLSDVNGLRSQSA